MPDLDRAIDPKTLTEQLLQGIASSNRTEDRWELTDPWLLHFELASRPTLEHLIALCGEPKECETPVESSSDRESGIKRLEHFL